MRTPTAVLAASSLALVLAACGLGRPAAPDFSDVAYRVEGRLTGADGVGSTTVIYRDGDRMRVETALDNRDPVVVVFNEDDNRAYVLRSVAGANVAMLAPENETPQVLEAAWRDSDPDALEHLGGCEAAGVQGQLWREATGDATACITDEGVVLRVTNGERVTFEATNVAIGPQDPALFGIPAGYQIVDPAAMIQQIEDTMEQLDAVDPAADGAAADAPIVQPAQPTPAPTTPSQTPAEPRTDSRISTPPTP
jgi:hypothetical protein